MHGAGEIGRRRELLRRAQKHRRVAVMAAGMHLVGVDRRMLELVLLLQVQRIHVGAQTDRLLARPLALQGADDAGLGQPAMDFDAPGLQFVGHDLRRPLLLEGGLGMTVDVAADGGEAGVVGRQQVGRKSGHVLPFAGAKTSRRAGIASRSSPAAQATVARTPPGL